MGRMRCQASFQRVSKSLFLTATLCLSALALGSGCARYKVTMANGAVTTSRGKPKYDRENCVYRFKDVTGEKRVVPEIRVVSIEPY